MNNSRKATLLFRRTQGKFNAVGVDMALEQKINLSQKSSGGIIGQTKRRGYFAKWELSYHEILLIRKKFQELLNVTPVDYELIMHHGLTGNLRSKMEANIQQMLLYVESRENPYLGTGEKRLHNIITNECVPDLNAQKILKF